MASYAAAAATDLLSSLSSHVTYVDFCSDAFSFASASSRHWRLRHTNTRTYVHPSHPMLILERRLHVCHPTETGSVVQWLGRRTCDSLVVSLVFGRRTIGRLALGWVIIFGRHTISVCNPSQLSLLPSVGRQMNTGQSAVMRCCWGVKAGWLILFEDRQSRIS